MTKTTDPDDARRARESLACRGLPFSEAHFLRHVRSGNSETVSLYLQAGISPDTRLDGETALAASVNGGFFDITRLLLKWGANPVGMIEGLKTADKAKDWWARLSSISGVFTFASSLIVASIGWYFTSSYNSRQLELHAIQATRDQQNKDYQNRLAEMQTVEKMIPHLTKDEASKRAALIAIGVLATPRLAAQIAEAYGGQGSIDALAQLATAEKDTRSAPAVAALTNLASIEQTGAVQPAHTALASVLAGREKAIVKIIVEGNAVCNGFVVDGQRGWIATPGYCLKTDSASLPTVEFNDGTKVTATNAITSKTGLLAFLNSGQQGLPEILLSATPPRVGGAVIQLAFDLAGRNDFGVVLGKVLESKQMSFIGQKSEVEAHGLLVTLAAGERQLAGTGGAPLLDNQGSVACMTFQTGINRHQQCLAADSIADAVSQLPK